MPRKEPLYPHKSKSRQPLFPHMLPATQDKPGDLQELLTNRDKMTKWLETKGLAITTREYQPLVPTQPFTICAIKSKKYRTWPGGPLSEYPPDNYEIIECRETTSWWKTEPELFTVLFKKFGEVTIKDAIPVEDGSKETMKRLIRRLKESTDEHISVRKEELEEFRGRVENAIDTLEEQGRDTSTLEERLDAVESAIGSLEKGKLQEAIGELEFVS